MSDLSNPSDASNAPVLLHPGDFVRVKATASHAVIVGHEMDRGTLTYRIGFATGAQESGLLVKDFEGVE